MSAAGVVRLFRTPAVASGEDGRAGAANVRNDTRQSHASDPSRMPSVVLDAQSREVIDRSLNAAPRRVRRQMPEAAARRLKAYARFTKDDAAPRDPQADIEV